MIEYYTKKNNKRCSIVVAKDTYNNNPLLGHKPSEECKAVVFQALYEWFKEIPFTNLNQKNLALGEVVGKEAFLSRMQRLFEDAIFGNEWDEEKRKSDYSKWMEDKLVDALYNTTPVLEGYRKL
jgi:hypothetical protein